MTVSLRAAICSFCAVLAVVGAASAQEPAGAAFVGNRISEVTFAVEGRSTVDPSLSNVLETHRGDPLSLAAVRETIDHLYSLGRFEDVQVEAAHALDGGVTLRYLLEPIHSVDRVEFRGTLGLSDEALRRRMTERFGLTPPAGRAADVAETLEQYYHDQGYLSATVKAAPPVVAHNPDRATLIFDIASGPQARIAEVSMAGTPLDSRDQVLSRLNAKVGDAYSPQDLRQRLEAYVAAMRHRGYYEAAASSRTRAAGTDPSQVSLTLDIASGPRVTVRYEGDPLPKDKLSDLVPIEREGSVDEDLLEDSARRITDYLRGQGYWKASVAAPERRQDDNQLTLVFKVNRGALYRVAPGGLEISGNHSLPQDELNAQLAQPAARITPGEPFLAGRLDAVVGALRALYQRHGFPDATIQSAANETGPAQVKPVIVIKEGQQVRIGGISVDGNAHIPTEQVLRSVTQSREGAPFYSPSIAADRDAIVEQYLNAGYEAARVTVDLSRSADGATAAVAFRISEGPQTIVDHILIVGNTRTDPDVIQRELQFQPGKPLGYNEILESRRRLSALGLFRRVQIDELPHGSPTARDVVVTVEEALRTTIGFGGGAEIDRRLRATGPNGDAQERYEFAPRGFFEIGRRNLGGKNRSVNLYTRLSLRPNSDPNDSSAFGFSEYRVVGTYREPRAFSNYGDLTATAAVEQGVRTTFNFARKGINAELAHRISPHVRASGRYSFSTTRVFDDGQLTDADRDRFTIDRVFPQVRLSEFSASVARDTRDDLLEPQKGYLVTADGTLAARGIGSQVGFTKTVLEGFIYQGLGRPHLVFAGGARLGIANPFRQVVQVTDPDTGVVSDQVIRDLPASERFFAGGDTTIRGFALDAVGAPDTISAQGFPIGGNGLVIFNAELRAPIWREVGAALFVDTGNVFRRAADIDLGQLRGSVGFGLRYRSPIGPIRVDLGFKLDRRVIGGAREAPYALHFSIGQAF